jgi:membrane protease YdiL (CAAX protease family)
MNNLTKWIKQHQVAVFFLLAYAITWGALIPAIAMSSETRALFQVLVFYLARIGVYGPALAGIIVTRVAAPERGERSRGARWTAFFAVWIVAWAVSCLYVRRFSSGEIELPVVIVLTAPSAMLPAFVVSSAFSRVSSLRRYLSTLVRPRGSLVWYLVALLTFPAIQVFGNGITRLMSGGSFQSSADVGIDLIGLAILEFLSVFFFSGGINEESGWRGFALPRLQASYSPLVANLILWFFWAAWHLPIDLVEFSREWHVINRVVLLPFVTILFGWVYNRTRGSILAVALFHASMNAMNVLMEVFPVTNAGHALLIAFGLFAILYDRMWKKLPVDSGAVYEAASRAGSSDEGGIGHATV